jgi:hypothetical protein
MLTLLAFFVTMLAAIVIAMIPIALVLVAFGIFGAIRCYRRWMLTTCIGRDGDPQLSQGSSV